MVVINKKFGSNEECAVALYRYLTEHGHITAKEPFVQGNNILHDINNLRGYEWLELLPRNAETEAFFAYLDPEYVPHFYGDGALLEDTFIFDNSITPGEYWELATGEAGVVISSLDALRNKMDEAGLGEVCDYPMSDINEAVANNEHLALVDDGQTVNYPNNECRVFEVTDEMYERYEKMYGQALGLEVDDVLASAVEESNKTGALSDEERVCVDKEMM